MGGQVLLRNTKEQGKLASKYESSPYTVTGKEGTELTLKSQTGDEYRHNSSFVRPYYERDMVDVTEQQGLDRDQTGTDEQGLNQEPTGKPPTSSTSDILGSLSVSIPVKTRLCRVTKRPAKLSVYLFGVLRHFQNCTGHITTGSWKGRGNKYIQFIRVLYCKLPTNGKQLPIA